MEFLPRFDRNIRFVLKHLLIEGNICLIIRMCNVLLHFLNCNFILRILTTTQNFFWPNQKQIPTLRTKYFVFPKNKNQQRNKISLFRQFQNLNKMR